MKISPKFAVGAGVAGAALIALVTHEEKPTYAKPDATYCASLGDGLYGEIDPATAQVVSQMTDIQKQNSDYTWGHSSTDPTGSIGFNVHFKKGSISFCELAGNDGEGRRIYPKAPSGPTGVGN